MVPVMSENMGVWANVCGAHMCMYVVCFQGSQRLDPVTLMVEVLPSFNGTWSSPGTDIWHREEWDTHSHRSMLAHSINAHKLYEATMEPVSITRDCYIEDHLITEITWLSPNKVWQFKIPSSSFSASYITPILEDQFIKLKQLASGLIHIVSHLICNVCCVADFTISKIDKSMILDYFKMLNPL